MENELRAFWPTDAPVRVLARRWWRSTCYVSMHAKALGLPSRKSRMTQIRNSVVQTRFNPRIAGRLYMEAEAQRRGLSTGALERLIIATVANDKMVDAILDDADQLADRQVA